MKNLSWEEVAISLETPDATSDPWIVIQARGVSSRKRSSEFGFFTERGKPATRLFTLAKFCRANGFIYWPDSKATETVSKRLEDEENDLKVFGRTDEEDDREEAGDDDDTLEGVDDKQETVPRVRRKPPVEKHQVQLFRNHLKDLLGIDDDPIVFGTASADSLIQWCQSHSNQPRRWHCTMTWSVGGRFGAA